MIGLALKLLGIGRWLKQALGALLGAVGRYPWQAAIIASLCLSGWLWRAKNIERAGWVAEIAARQSDRAAYQAAQVEAAAKQLAADQANVTLQNERNRITIYVQTAAEAHRRDDVARYVSTHGVRCEAAPGAGSGTLTAGLPVNPAKPDDTPEPAGMALIAPADLDKLTREAVQGAVRYEWLKSQVDSGQAVVVPDIAF